MTISPDQARELLDGATLGPWREDGSNIMNHDGDPLLSDGSFGDPNWYNVRDLTLMTAAPDLAQTIAGMEYEYRTEEWSGTYWYPCELWTSDLSQYDGYTERKGERLVRRLVGPVETIKETPND